MGIGYNEIRTEISLSAIEHNLEHIRSKCANPIPVIKADAYGHGLSATAETLANCGVKSLAAGTVSESVALREIPFSGEILSLLGPVKAEDYPNIVRFSIVPFIGNFEQLHKLEKTSCNQPIAVALKFSTGMSRLGFEPGQTAQVAKTINRMENIKPVYLCSHLAAADSPEQKEFTTNQANTLEHIDKTLKEPGIKCQRCLANSAATLSRPDLHMDAQRPGISLYGGNPFHGNEWTEKGEGLQQAMQVKAPIMETRELERGQSISYGRTFRAPHKMRVAIVACGYADNYSRGLSNTGWMLVRENRAPILGRVCMQLTAVDVTHIPQAQPGDWAYLLGGPGKATIRAEELAKWWETISYEIFCQLGQNQRFYLP